MASIDTNSLDLLEFAHSLADASRGIILRHFRTSIEVEAKKDFTPVTLADREAEKNLRELIFRSYPDHGVTGKEFERVNPESNWQWVLDPIDGTRAFITGSPIFGTLIALLNNDRPHLGIIDIPAPGERWSGFDGGPCRFRQTYPIPSETICLTSENENLEKAVVFSTDPSMFEDLRARQTEALFSRVKMRRFGGDCYIYGQLASGWIDLVTEADMQFHDAAALLMVVESAGGLISDWQGQPIKAGWDGTVLASATPELHRKVLALFQKVREGSTS